MCGKCQFDVMLKKKKKRKKERKGRKEEKKEKKERKKKKERERKKGKKERKKKAFVNVKWENYIAGCSKLACVKIKYLKYLQGLKRYMEMSCFPS